MYTMVDRYDNEERLGASLGGRGKNLGGIGKNLEGIEL
jgi:hypothetical protein